MSSWSAAIDGDSLTPYSTIARSCRSRVAKFARLMIEQQAQERGNQAGKPGERSGHFDVFDEGSFCTRRSTCRFDHHSMATLLPRLAARTTFRQATALNTTASRSLAFQTRSLRSLSDLSAPLESQADALKKLNPNSSSSSTKMSSTPPPAVTVAPKPAVKTSPRQSLVLTLSCPDQRGIVHTVTGWLASRSFDIRDSAQYGDPDTGRFFMRVHAEGPDGRNENVEALRREFGRDVGELMKMDFSVEDEVVKPKTMLMVSKIGREFAMTASRGICAQSSLTTAPSQTAFTIFSTATPPALCLWTSH